MLSVNKKKLSVAVIRHDYVKDMRNLEKYTIDVFWWVKNLSRSDDHVQYGKNRIKVK